MRRRLPLILSAAALTVAIAILAVLLVGGEDDGGSGAGASRPQGSQVLAGSGGAGFELVYPRGWSELPEGSLGRGAERAVAGVKRDDGQGLLLVQRRGALEGQPSPADIARDLDRRLRRQFKDFRRVGSETVELAGGEALSYTFVRTRTGRVQNIVVLSEEKRTWTLNSVLPAGADDAAREVATMIRSFDPAD